MSIDYNAVRLYHGVEAIYSDELTHCRLQEVRNYPHCREKRYAGLKKTACRISDSINNTEQQLLAAFPVQGISLGYYSNALMFAPAIHRLPVTTHKAYIGLLRAGFLGIVTGKVDGKPHEVLVRL